MKINFLPVSLALSVLFSFSVKAQSSDPKRLLLNYEFNQNAENDLIIDSSQSKNHAKIKGDGVTVTDGMLILPGGDQIGRAHV